VLEMNWKIGLMTEQSASHLGWSWVCFLYSRARAKVKDNPYCLSWLKSSRDSSGGAQITLWASNTKMLQTFLFLPQPRTMYFPLQMTVKAKSPGASLDIPTTNERKSNTVFCAAAVLHLWRPSEMCDTRLPSLLCLTPCS